MNEKSQRTKSIASTSSISRCEISSQQIYLFYHLPPSQVQTKYSNPPVMAPLARPVMRYCIRTSTMPINNIAPIRIHLFSIFLISTSSMIFVWSLARWPLRPCQLTPCPHESSSWLRLLTRDQISSFPYHCRLALISCRFWIDSVSPESYW